MSLWNLILDAGWGSRPDTRMVAEANGDVRIIHEQDATLFLKRNAELRNNGHDGYTKDRTMRRAASIPPIVVAIWRAQYDVDVLNPDHREKVFQLLDDPEWSHLKTVDAKLSKRKTRSYLRASTSSAPKPGTILKPGE